MLGLNKPTLPDRRVPPVQTDLLGSVIAAEALAYVLADRQGRIVEVGGDFETITGRAAEGDTLGKSLATMVSELKLRNADGSPVVDDEQTAAIIAAILKSGDKRRLHALALAEDGRTVSINTWFPGDGTALVSLRDVSDIAEDREMLDVAVRAASAGYWSLDFKTGKFAYSDSVLARLSERERDLIQRNGLFSIIHKDDLTRISGQWQDIVSGVAPFDLCYRVNTETEGLMWQRSIGQLQRRPDGKLTKAVAFVMDITEDMQNRADLEEAQSLAKAKEDFMARMSHEIRTPLNAIIGMADSLADEAMSDTVRDVLGDMETAAENLHELLSRTLDHAQIEAGAVTADFVPTDPRAALRSCADMWRAKAEGKGLAFRVAVGPDVPARIPLDSFRLRQCLNNLIGNAIKFTDSGQVALAARAVKHKGRPHLAVIVQDTGIGMSAEDQTSIFDAYRQADGSISRRFGGTGLGLSICKQLADLMDGSLSVRSEPGKGSAFLLFLPFEPKTQGEASLPTPAEDTEAPEGRLPFEGLSVLCVEDNPINQKVVERLIGGRVDQIHFANHGREALSILNTTHIDVVLMDIHMPVMDGIETTMEIRKSDAPYANVIIIALTADPDYQQLRICKNIGMDDTIAKPVRRDDILQAFNRSMDRINRDFGVKVALR